MEEALLKDMIQERDKKIAQLNSKTEDLEEKIEKTRNELRKVKTESSTNKLGYRRQVAELVKKRDEGLVKIQTLEKEVRNQNGSLHGYADILKEVAPTSVDSSYVVRMQSQLCKAMHSMGILEHQLGIVNQISSDVVKAQKDAMTSIVDEKSKMELEVMNELMAMDGEHRKAAEARKEQLEKEQLLVVEMRKKLGEFEEDDSQKKENEDEEDDDEDTVEMEMKEALEELQDMIAEMEEENAAQLKTIEMLRGEQNGKASPREDEAAPTDTDSKNEADTGSKDESGDQEDGNSPVEEVVSESHQETNGDQPEESSPTEEEEQ